jgi:hypothetical protein
VYTTGWDWVGCTLLAGTGWGVHYWLGLGTVGVTTGWDWGQWGWEIYTTGLGTVGVGVYTTGDSGGYTLLAGTGDSGGCTLLAGTGDSGGCTLLEIFTYHIMLPAGE